MQILLVAATEFEIGPFLQQNPGTDHLITGVGCPAAVYQLSKRLHQIDYDLVIQAGIGGSFPGAFGLGDVVLVKEDNFADLGIAEKNNFFSIFEKGFADENTHPFNKGWLENNNSLLDQVFIPKARAITVNTVTDKREQIDLLISKFLPQVETMEGAALHYVCLQENIPFLQIRGISNDVGERDKTKWKMQEAIINLNDELMSLFNMLTS